ncbi:MAG: M23 family metallopeptidase [Firmicutes bacterium]|nr:M23 family metallopeptidase [Dethiobacter sp.]MBS3887715.1 M23 family metallopeptidase [Bacillota bacterium]MBS4053826.1 M23 family metallopeptidase [Thermaerobacter sp.]
MILRIKALVNRLRLKGVLLWHRLKFSLPPGRVVRLFRSRRFLMASYLLVVVLLAGVWWWNSPYRLWGTRVSEPPGTLEPITTPPEDPPEEPPVITVPPLVVTADPVVTSPPGASTPPPEVAAEPVAAVVTRIEQLTKPIAGPIIAPYGFQWSATFQAFQYHHGVGIEATIGTPVVAAHGGRVVSIGQQDPAWGTKVTIDHGSGWQTVYANLRRVTVRVDQVVTTGQELGQLDTNPAAKGAEATQLYFALYKEGESVDPTYMFR